MKVIHGGAVSMKLRKLLFMVAIDPQNSPWMAHYKVKEKSRGGYLGHPRLLR